MGMRIIITPTRISKGLSFANKTLDRFLRFVIFLIMFNNELIFEKPFTPPPAYAVVWATLSF